MIVPIIVAIAFGCFIIKITEGEYDASNFEKAALFAILIAIAVAQSFAY